MRGVQGCGRSRFRFSAVSHVAPRALASPPFGPARLAPAGGQRAAGKAAGGQRTEAAGRAAEWHQRDSSAQLALDNIVQRGRGCRPSLVLGKPAQVERARRGERERERESERREGEDGRARERTESAYGLDRRSTFCWSREQYFCVKRQSAQRASHTNCALITRCFSVTVTTESVLWCS